MSNLLWKLIGRRAGLYGTVADLKKPGGTSVPGMAFMTKASWFGEQSVHALDLLSFLMIAEALGNHTDRSKDFVYDHMHETTPVKVVIPAWALPEMQEACGVWGPRIYDKLKDADRAMQDMAKLGKEKGWPDEMVNTIAGTSGVEKYKQLHAQVHGYTYIPTKEGEEKTVH